MEGPPPTPSTSAITPESSTLGVRMPGERGLTAPSVERPIPFQQQHGPPPQRISDVDAAGSVVLYFNGRNRNARQQEAERELIKLLGSSTFCEEQIRDVMNWADILFFEEKLRSKVQWRWSESLSRNTIGTTRVRSTSDGSFMTQITLSRQVLGSDRYDQRLVLSAILHEAIHSYLFVCRGFDARQDGGHSAGFREIAELIDDWIGDQEYLQLYNMKAELDKFLRKGCAPSRSSTNSGSGGSSSSSSSRSSSMSRDSGIGGISTRGSSVSSMMSRSSSMSGGSSTGGAIMMSRSSSMSSATSRSTDLSGIASTSAGVSPVMGGIMSSSARPSKITRRVRHRQRLLSRREPRRRGCRY
ncbi:MAG: hypothetical protein M1832_004955 [Thelocarpon impressellum]|nr:MAG: hypothetical protein M1832_004955 [Thelocarpon impressellum]